MDFFSIISAIDSFLWGPPLIILLVGTGIYLTLRLKLLQVAKLPLAMKLILSAKNKGDGDISSFKALCDEIIKEAEDKNVIVYVISAAAVLCAVGVFTVVRKKGKKCVR